jgi:hypothetical protein
MTSEMKMNKLVKLCMMMAVVAIVFGCVPRSYGQETSTTDESIAPANSQLSYVDAGEGYKINHTVVLSEAGHKSNIAVGYVALHNNKFGSQNTALGNKALYSNIQGYGNTASGTDALQANDGSGNTANGYDVLGSNTNGGFNTAIGYEALFNNTTGSGNIAIGFAAGSTLTSGNNYNIEIGNYGSSEDTGVIRIGCSYSCDGGPQTSAYIAGIYGAPTTGSGNPLVCVDSTGLLGTTGCAATDMIETLQRQNEELQQRLSRLEALIAKK